MFTWLGTGRPDFIPPHTIRSANVCVGAEEAGLEPAIPRRETVFETVAIATKRLFQEGSEYYISGLTAD